MSGRPTLHTSIYLKKTSRNKHRIIFIFNGEIKYQGKLNYGFRITSENKISWLRMLHFDSK